MFNSITDLSSKLATTGYFIDPVMTRIVFLAAKLQKPLLLEGPAGSGKTQLAVSVAQAAGTHIERLQCYRGVTEDTQQPTGHATRQGSEGKSGIEKSKLIMLGGGLLAAVLFLALTSLVNHSSTTKKAAEKQPSHPVQQQTPSPSKGSVTPLMETVQTNVQENTSGQVHPGDIKRTSTPAQGAGDKLGAASPAKPHAGSAAGANTLGAIPSFSDTQQKWEEPQPYGETGHSSSAQMQQTQNALKEASLVFVRAPSQSQAAGTVTHALVDTGPVLEMTPGSRIEAKLETQISSAVLAPVVAVVEYTYAIGDRIVVPAGARVYADDLFNIFYRMEPSTMAGEGFAYGGQGRRDFQQQYGVLETIEKVRETDNACSRATKKTIQVLKKPGASPLLFGKFLMNTTAFLSLEDIADNLPRYDESVLSVEMDEELAKAYEEVEEDIRSAIRSHRGNKSLMSILLNTLLLYPDHPYGFEDIWARAFDPETKEYVKFLVTTPQNLKEDSLYAKERALVADVREELRQGRRCQVYATYTGEKDVTLRLETVLRQAGFRVAVLRSSAATDKREDWYERQLKDGVEVVICHPKLVETGLDLLAFPTLYFYETGYSLHTLRQASRRSWRIGQRYAVRVKFVTYTGTMQETCLRLMGKKMLVALMMEGKFSGEGLQSLDTDEDLMSAMARELVEKAGVGASADQMWRELEREREKVLPQPAAERVEEAPLPSLESQIAAAQELFPVGAGIHLVDPPAVNEKRTKRSLWSTATEPAVQLNLFG